MLSWMELKREEQELCENIDSKVDSANERHILGHLPDLTGLSLVLLLISSDTQVLPLIERRAHFPKHEIEASPTA